MYQRICNLNFLFIFLLLIGWNTWAVDFLPKSFHTHFEKKYISGIYGKEVITKGEIFYQFPGKLRIDTFSPEQELLISGPEKTILYTPPFIEGEKGTLSVKPNQELGHAKIFDLLKKGLKNNKNNKFFSVKDVPPNGKELVFANQFQEKYKITHLVIIFRGQEEVFSNIQSIKVIHWDKKEETFAFSQLQVDIPIEKNKFDFEPPPNTMIQ